MNGIQEVGSSILLGSTASLGFVDDRCLGFKGVFVSLSEDLSKLGISPKKVFYNLGVEELVDEALKRGEGFLASNGALVVSTGERTGRSPKDRYIVKEASSEGEIWWGEINKPTSEDRFLHLLRRISEYLNSGDVFVFDGFAGADRDYSLRIRVVTRKAWHSLFARTLFIRPSADELKTFSPQFTVIDASDDFRLDPNRDGFGSEVSIVLNFKDRMLLIAGSGYGGEIKKGIFSVMNYLLPKQGVFPMHCSANVGKSGDTALFFGLSGTGKTSLSADPERSLIGDDEHGWSPKGVFNFEGGCYAKCINLSKEKEPQIYNAIRFGSICENVVVSKSSGDIDFSDSSITENTRATYPVEYIPNCITSGIGGHPKNIFFLACDAFGVLPPIARLTPQMAMYHFLSGYTAKLAGTEVGILEPVAVFSPCFGAPFLPLHPMTYARMLGDNMKKHGAKCWLVNTGWVGGGYGEGERIKIEYTRAMLRAALNGDLDDVEFSPHPFFKVLVPRACPGVPPSVLDPEGLWREKDRYRAAANKLASLFGENFKKFKEEVIPSDILEAQPCTL